ncbi:unnamed protein product, partial [Meganyctiphanes norvegica]
MEEVVKSVSELSTTDNAVKTQKPAEQNKKAEQKQKKKDANKSGGAGAKEMNPWPEFIQERLNLWDKLKKEADEALAAKVPTPIKVTLPDGAVKEGESWRTTPFMIAQGISQGLAESTIVAKVNGDVWDLDRPLEDDCSLQLLKFTDDDAKTVYSPIAAHDWLPSDERSSSWHAFELPVDARYHTYYEYSSSKFYSGLKSIIELFVASRSIIELFVASRSIIDLFVASRSIIELLKIMITLPESTYILYLATLVLLCYNIFLNAASPSIITVTDNCYYTHEDSIASSGSCIYNIIKCPWEFIRNISLKIMYAWSMYFKTKPAYYSIQQKLFFFHELSPGSCFFTARGAYIYNALIEFIKEQYRTRGFHEVISPNVYNTKLWEQSGHWQHYAENMFAFEVEKEKFALKPMNCPGHCLMFSHTNRSWRELPLRMADFGVLHRNELSGALTGLTRVRRFQQDDAHIFCTPEMIKSEIKGALEFLSVVYKTFGFEFDLRLSTRPEKYLGEISVWDEAEKQLKESLDESGNEWKLNPGDGAFYGPKIDITVTDALRRHHQCATIQLDFQLPLRFDLSYVSESGDKKRPVIIHRAILGSVERMIAILTESYGGKWPFWLSPRQCMVVPVAPPFDDYAKEVQAKLWQAGIQAEFDVDPSDTMNKKIRNAQLEQWNFIFVVGEKEKTNGTLNVRTRDNKVHGEHTVEDVITKLKALKSNRVQNWEDSF